MNCKITKPIHLIETFSGIGCQSMAFKRLGADISRVTTSEWDINSVASYKAIHCPEDDRDYSHYLTKDELIVRLASWEISSDGKKPMDISKISHKSENWLRTVYNNFMATNNLGSITNIHARDLQINKFAETTILFYSFPCTDLSLAGLQKGMDRGSNTASSLLWEIERILYECQEINCLPDILCMENVTAVHGKNNLENWNVWIKSLEKLGYHNFYQDLNAKDYGTAQTRDRCFMFSFLEDVSYEFPNPIKLRKIFRDYLKFPAPENFYVNTEKADKLIKELLDKGQLNDDVTTISVRGLCNSKYDVSGKPIDVAHTLLQRDYKGISTWSCNGVIEHERGD